MKPARVLAAVDTTMLWLLPAVLVVLLLLTAGRFAGANWQEWNDGRLAPSAAVLAGHDLYDAPQDGPLLGAVYGPLSPVIYTLPLLLTDSAPMAILLASMLTFILFAGPVVRLVFTDPGVDRLPAIYATVAFCLYGLYSRVLLGVAFNVHADAPALGFALLACILLQAPSRLPGGDLAASVAVVLALGSKQTIFPAFIALVVYVWLAHGRRRALRFAALVAVVGAVVLALLTPILDPGAMLFNAIVVPSRHPWQGEGSVQPIVRGVRDLLPRVFPAALLVVLGIVAEVSRARRATLTEGVGVPDRAGWGAIAAGWREKLHRARWVAPVLVGVACVPTTLLGRAKFGGSLNTLAFTLYFIAAAAALVVAKHACGERWRALWRGGLLAMTLGLTAATAHSGLPGAIENLRQAGASPEAAAFAFARAHPGTVYFPFHPLVGILAEGRRYHFSDAVAARELAGFEVSESWFYQHLPASMQLVATHRDYADYSFRYLPQCSEVVPIEQLPGWIVRRCVPGPVGR